MRGLRKKLGAAAVVATVAAAVVGFVALAGGVDRELTTSAPLASSAGLHDSAQGALEELNELEEAQPELSIAEYRREYFGSGWATVDGCSIRNLVLERDLVDVQWLDGSCVVAAGTLDDPYTGEQLQFQHDAVAEAGNPGSQGVQIDHLVSLRAAWFAGAHLWAAQEREAFANDLENLLAVDGRANNSKNALGPAEWLVPSNQAYRCDFAVSYVQVSSSWQLAISNEDRAALEAQLQQCL